MRSASSPTEQRLQRPQAAPAPRPPARLQGCPVEVPLPGLSAPQDGAGSQPSCPFPVLLPAQPVPAGSLLPREDQSCVEPCSEHTQQGQDSSPEGKALSCRGRSPSSHGTHTPEPAGVFSRRGHERLDCFITAPLPDPARRDLSRASASKVSLAPPASSGPAPMVEKQEQKSPQDSFPAWLLFSVIPSRHPSLCPDRRVTPSPPLQPPMPSPNP